MYLMQVTYDLTARVQEIAFGISILISGLFLLEYRKYMQDQERTEMIEQFLQDTKQ